MHRSNRRLVRGITPSLPLMALLVALATPAAAGEYDSALAGVQGIDVVFEVSQGSPAVSNIVFWAIRDVYRNPGVKALAKPPRVAIVFHGPAVKLLSSDRTGFAEADGAELDKFAETIRQLKKDGVKLEVCRYALEVMKVDPATVMPEVDQVGNGFISVAGYQAQGYGVIRVP
ncbi:MAG TPA: DsrE family protein [Myxococcota bacterium]